MLLGQIHPQRKHPAKVYIVALGKLRSLKKIVPFFSALEFCIGALIDEAQEDSYIARRSCSKARKLLVMKWMVVGFFFSISYKSVLRAMMIKIEYGKTIDTIDDMLQSEMPLMIASDTPLLALLETDPRKKVKALSEKVEWYEDESSLTPVWIDKG